MLILGIESSCDETSAAVVEEGRVVRALVTNTQTAVHAQFEGVVPEVASRAHTEVILPVVEEVLRQAGLRARDVDVVAATARPGLSGSLMVGFNFGKAFAAAVERPFVAVDHMLAHAFAVQLERPLVYPYAVLLVSGGHTLVGVSRTFDELEVVGTTIDDACGEAFDKVSTFLGLGYPGGPRIDSLAAEGDRRAFVFPKPRLHRADQRYDVSYSGLKTAVVHQLSQFHTPGYAINAANIAAAFQHAAIEMVVERLSNVCIDYGMQRVGVGGGVAANSELRARLGAWTERNVVIPRIELCMDNGAMVAGLAYHLYRAHGADSLDSGVQSRVAAFRHRHRD